MIDVTAHNEETGIRFPGIITLPTGDDVEAELELRAGGIALSAAGSDVGRWGFGECRLEATGDGSFELIADDEVLGFAPRDPDGFWMAFLGALEADVDRPADPGGDPAGPSLRLVDADGEDEPGPDGSGPAATAEEAGRLRSGRLRLASAVSAARRPDDDRGNGGTGGEDEVADRQEAVSDHILADLRSKTKVHRFSREDLRDGAKKAGAVLVALVVVGLLAWTTPQLIDAFQEPAAAPSTTVAPAPSSTAAPAPSTTAAPVDTTPDPIVPDAAVFDRPAPEFFAAWNEVGGEITSVLEFPAYPPAGPFETEFTSFLRSSGVVAEDGTLDTFSVIVDPLGPTGSDRLGLQTLGVLIAVVDPAVSPEGRAQLLSTLGLDVRDPRLGGIQGETVRNGVRYRLVYDSETVLLTFTASASS